MGRRGRAHRRALPRLANGLAPQRARQIASIARRIGDLPECVDAFRRGELAVDQMAAIAARAPWWTDSEVCGLAKLLTVGQLRRTLARYPFPEIEPPADNPAPSDSDGGADTASDQPAIDDTDGDTHDSPDDSQNDRRSGNGGVPDPGAPTATEHMWWGIGDDGVFRLQLACNPLTDMVIEAALNFPTRSASTSPATGCSRRSPSMGPSPSRSGAPNG